MKKKVYPRTSVIACALLASKICWAKYDDTEDPVLRSRLRFEAHRHEARAKRLRLMLDVAPEMTVFL